jgi:peptide/nickel transport system substrate-binding protein
MRVLAIALNTLKAGSPFRDERVRQAVNYGVNRQAITETLLGGLVDPASQATIPEALGYDPDLKAYPYDPDKAKALLAEAGYASGFAFTYEFPVGTLPSDGAIMQQIASDLGKIGVTMNVIPISYAMFTRYYTQGGWRGEALLADYPVTSLDALRSFYRSAHSCDWPAAWYCDRAIQGVIDDAGIEPDLAKRTAMTQQVLRHYHGTAQSLLLFPILGLDALGQRIIHWEPWNDIIQFHRIEIAED